MRAKKVCRIVANFWNYGNANHKVIINVAGVEYEVGDIDFDGRAIHIVAGTEIQDDEFAIKA